MRIGIERMVDMSHKMVIIIMVMHTNDDDNDRYALYGSATVLVISVGQGVWNIIIQNYLNAISITIKPNLSALDKVTAS